jgi:hypothetical protein
VDPSQKKEPQKKDKMFKNYNASPLRYVDFKWAGKTLLWTFSISILLSILSSYSARGLGFVAAILLLLFMVLTGIVFDIVGIAVTTANEAVFHSMSSRRVKGGKEAVWLVRNASKVSNFCNDVIGDIVGIISGTTTAIIATRFTAGIPVNEAISQIVLTGLIAGFTVGGKALGKGVAISMCDQIIFAVGRIMSFFNGLRGKGA